MERVQDIGSLKILAQLRPDVRAKPSPVITLVFLKRFNKLEPPYHLFVIRFAAAELQLVGEGYYLGCYCIEPFCLTAPPCDNLSRSAQRVITQLVDS
jgi:hypothetical protein